MRIRYNYAGTMAVLCALTAIGAAVLTDRIARAQDRTAATITFRESLLDRSGNARRSSQFYLAARSDGSTSQGRSWPKPGNRGMAEQRKVLNLGLGEEFYVDGLTESITSYPLAESLVDHYRRGVECGSGSGTPQAEKLLGYDVVKVVRELPGDPGKTRIERWLAPSLGCLELKKAFSQALPGTEDYAVLNLQEAVEVKLGEPDAGLFEKPSGYTERAPSARRAEYHRLYPERASQPCPECMQNNDRDGDAAYFNRKGDRAK